MPRARTLRGVVLRTKAGFDLTEAGGLPAERRYNEASVASYCAFDRAIASRAS
jgi:hypothetical protein